jgi:tetratricopeptide (TPR) repeat protein
MFKAARSLILIATMLSAMLTINSCGKKADKFKPEVPDVSIYKFEYTRAIADYTKIIEKYPDCEEAYLQRGLAHRNNQEYDSAFADFTHAIDIKRDYFSAYLNRGITKFIQHDCAGIPDFDKALKYSVNDSQKVEALINRGSLKFFCNDETGSIADYTKAIGLDPNYDGYYNRGLVYEYIGKMTEANADYAKAAELKSASKKR